MNKKKKTIRKMMLALSCAGLLFIAFAIVLFVSKESFVQFPRADIAPVGFALVGFIYLICALGMFVVIQDKKALIEENDERSKTIEAKAGTVAYAVQTLLLFTGLFLMIFTGYLNVVSAFSLIVILVISVITFAAAQIYYGRKL